MPDPKPANLRRNPVEVHAVIGVEPSWAKDFNDFGLEWRRIFAEMLGTFMLVVVGAGAPMVQVVSHGAIGRNAAVVAPALMVMAIIFFMGTVSGAHLNPIVSLAFALRKEFPWARIPGYVIAQIVGASLSCLFLWAMFGKVAMLGATVPGVGINNLHAGAIEALLTFGLVSTILGTASGAQNVGSFSAVAVAGYIALAGLWASPISGASMNPARSFGPDLITGHFTHFLPYLIGPTIGAVLAAGVGYILRGAGGDASAMRAAQGTLDTVIISQQSHGDTNDVATVTPSGILSTRTETE